MKGGDCMSQENAHKEFKREFTPGIKNEVVAFANTCGGTILVGLEDDGRIRGLADSGDVLLRITNMLRDTILPDITMFIQYEVLPTSVIQITVQEGTNKPYYLAEKGMKPSGVYVRQGTSSAPASWEQIRQMIKQTDGDRYELARSFEQCLTFAYAAEEFARRDVEFNDAKYVSLGIKNSAGLYTNLGLLLSDQCQHTLKIAVFDGKEKNVFIDRKEFSGSVLKQLRDAFDYLHLANKTRATIMGLDRIESKDYPDEAVREALLNAIVHRDYSFSGSTIVNVYDNRMEFISLGGLVHGLNKDDILMGISQTRNEKLAGVFFRLRHIEAYGTGIRKIMDLYARFNKQPMIKISNSAFVMEMPNMNDDSGERVNDGRGLYPSADRVPSKQHLQIMAYIKEHGSITVKEVQSLLGVKQTRSFVIMKEMLEKGFVRTEGRGETKRFVSR